MIKINYFDKGAITETTLTKRFKTVKMLVFLLFLLVAIEAKPQTSAQDMGLKGNVRVLITHKHVAKNIVIENNTLVSYEKLKLLHHIEHIFDKNGAMLAENRFDYQDIIDISFIYEYDASGKLIDLTVAKAGKILVGRTEYKYDKDGKKTQEIEYDNLDSLKTTTVYKYDSSGNLINEKVYNKIFFVSKDVNYQYDANGNLILVNCPKMNVGNGKPYKEVQKFDDKNRLIYKSYTRLDTLKWEYFASYNKNDSLIYEELKDGNGNLQSYSKLTFKKNKRISLKQYNYKAEFTQIDTYYQYDKQGRLLTEKLYTPDKKELLSVHTYFYDEKGNRIYCVEENKAKRVSIVHAWRFIFY